MTNLQNLPIPGFVADSKWGNQWHVGTNQNVAVYFDDAARLCLEKDSKFTLHTVLGGDAKDLDQLKSGHGVSLSVSAAYTVSLSTRNDRGVYSQLVLHEFNEAGERVSRLSLGNGERAVFIPEDSAGTLVLSLRLVGEGAASVESIEFNPLAETCFINSGLHAQTKLDKAPLVKVKPAIGLGSLMAIRRALHDGVSLLALLSRTEAKAAAEGLSRQGYALEAKEVTRQFDLYQDLPTSVLRKMFWHGRRSGYLLHAQVCMDEIVLRSGGEGDREAADRLRSEYEFHRDPWALMPALVAADFYDANGPVLHVVGKALPERQTGYTIRTKYTVEALQNAGIESVVAVQAGGNHDEKLNENVEHNLEGVRTILFAGPPKKDIPREEWMTINVEALYNLVQEIRPSVIHAHSDFVNGVLATHVGEASCIPVVYESRGFWEETWISRISKSQGWESIDHTVQMYGPPDLYELRRQSERRVRERANRLVTLAQTMKDFIIEESGKEVIPPDHIYLARNAVDPEDFPMGEANPEMLHSLGIEDDAVVVGYISSIVEYEGIETLIDSYRLLKQKHTNSRLLIVGDGPYLNHLKQHAVRVGLEDVIFTGRVPHDDILNYYYLIDIFVVPRRNTRVTELVTPLKPFEAFSTGRLVVLSDVAALAEIARDSGGAAKTFRADDAKSLADLLDLLMNHPVERAKMARAGAEWVRKARSWSSNVPAYQEMYKEIGLLKSQE